MARRARFASLGGVALLALLASPARADEPKKPEEPAGTAAERLAAAALESTNLRMRALIDQSGILDGAGRHEEAIAALRRVEEVQKEGLALVRELLARTPAPQVEVRGPVVRIGPDRPHPWARPGTRPRRAPSRIPGTREDPVPAAIDYLLRTQGADGLYEESVRATGWAVLGLLDPYDDLAREPRVALAVRRAVGGLVASQDTSGWIGKKDDVEGHVVATWALSTAVSRLGPSLWRDRGERTSDSSSHRWALERILGGVRPDDGWNASDLRVPEQMALAAWTAAALHEARPLEVVPSGSVDLVLGRLADWALRFRGAGLDHDGVAAALVLRAADRAVPDDLVVSPGPSHDWPPSLGPGGSADVLLRTTYFAYVAPADAWRAWEARLGEAIAAQRGGGPGPESGSWDPLDGETRTESTARHLLAWMAPQVEYRAPKR